VRKKKRGFSLRPGVNEGVSGELPVDPTVRAYVETIQSLYACVSRRVGGDRSLAGDVVREAWMRALDHGRAWVSPTAGLDSRGFYRED
jgi:hypothetical protein